MNSVAFFDKVSKTSLSVLAFLLPLWFLPFTQDILNFQKQALLVVVVLLAVIAWLAKTVSQGELKIRMSWLHAPVLLMVLVSGISTIFSKWPYGSFWGWPLNISDSFLTIFVFALLYFFIMNALEEGKDLFQLLFISIISGVLAGMFSMFQLLNVFILPFAFAKAATFNTVGTLNSIAILSAVLLPLALVLAYTSRLLLRWILWLLCVLLLLVVLAVNFLSAWIVLTVGLLILLGFGMWNLKKRTEFGWVSFPMALLIVALFFLTFRISLPGVPAAPIEVSPSRNAELSMLQKVFHESPIFGTGPGTFVLEYAKYHEPALNQTVFWGTRFSSGASEILDWFMTKGIGGGIVLVLTVIAAIIMGIQTLLKGKNESFSWMVGLGTLASFGGMAATLAFYSLNLTLWFFFWLLLGGLGVFLGGKQRTISIAPPSFLAVASSFIFLLVLIFGVGLLFIGGQKYAAEIEYLKGAKIISRGGDVQKGIAKILQAAQLNPWGDLYWRDLSQLYLNEVSQIASNAKLSDDEKKTQTQTAITNATSSARQAVLVAGSSVENWNVQGFIYRNLIGVTGADTAAIQSYEKAVDLEPASPFSWTELGRVYLLQGQNLANQKNMGDKEKEALDKALENLNKAVVLKSDYAPAHYLIALVYDQQGKSDEAIKKLEETTQIAPQDIGLAFQLGVVYYQKAEYDKAQAQFERAKKLDENYANARYMLGLVYDKQGDREKAKAEFTKVAALNPENDQIKKILDNLNAGKPALQGIQPGQPPVQENPPEIQKKK